MQSFLARHGSEVKGMLSGFDRLRFRGTIRWLSSRDGLGAYLGTMKIRLKDFREWSMARTAQINAATERLAEQAGRDVVYLPSSSERKETRALEIAQAKGVTEGLIAVLKCVEACHTFGVGPNAATRQIELQAQSRKCSHLYFYELHPEFGLMHLRLQTWVPFTIHVCLNGREWLARRLRRAGIGFDQRDNCFVDVDDVAAAQQLLLRQLRKNWPALLDGLVRRFHPAHRTLFGSQPLSYYWSAEETEWATDLMFRSPAALARIYPALLRHALLTFGSRDVLRFLGQLPRVDRRTTREIISSILTRPEGTRVKHASGRNSIKMYDKQQSVLRVETTINDPRDLKVYRPKEGDSKGPKSWLRMRKGVADLHRRAQLSQKSNERYLAALATTDSTEPLSTLVQPLCQPTEFQGRRVRALQPFSSTDQPLLTAVLRGEFALNGFRNRDLRTLLFGATPAPADAAKCQAAKITRMIRLLRSHGLIQKVSKTHRYTLTTNGRQTLAALQIAQQASSQKLGQIAI